MKKVGSFMPGSAFRLFFVSYTYKTAGIRFLGNRFSSAECSEAVTTRQLILSRFVLAVREKVNEIFA